MDHTERRRQLAGLSPLPPHGTIGAHMLQVTMLVEGERDEGADQVGEHPPAPSWP